MKAEMGQEIQAKETSEGEEHELRMAKVSVQRGPLRVMTLFILREAMALDISKSNMAIKEGERAVRFIPTGEEKANTRFNK